MRMDTMFTGNLEIGLEVKRGAEADDSTKHDLVVDDEFQHANTDLVVME